MAKNTTNNKSVSETKIIPRDIWKVFDEYWDNTEYKDLTAKDIKDVLGKHVFVSIPKNITDVKIADEWYKQMYTLREKGKPFGGYTACFKGDTTTLEELFGTEPIPSTQMTKKLWDYVKAKNEANPKVKENGGKKIVKVNSIVEMEKAVEKVKAKKGAK